MKIKIPFTKQTLSIRVIPTINYGIKFYLKGYITTDYPGTFPRINAAKFYYNYMNKKTKKISLKEAMEYVDKVSMEYSNKMTDNLESDR